MKKSSVPTFFYVTNNQPFRKELKKYCKIKLRKTFLAVSCKKYTFALANENSDALLAQLVEQLTLNQWVQGSNP